MLAALFLVAAVPELELSWPEEGCPTRAQVLEFLASMAQPEGGEPIHVVAQRRGAEWRIEIRTGATRFVRRRAGAVRTKRRSPRRSSPATQALRGPSRRAPQRPARSRSPAYRRRRSRSLRRRRELRRRSRPYLALHLRLHRWPSRSKRPRHR